jgi:hypothetical protein
MGQGSKFKDQLVHDLHDSKHHTADANARFLANQLELSGHSHKAEVLHPGVSRKDTTVTVTSKPLVMEVLHNAAALYSVAGYNARAKHCFGEIYLGLDAGPEYDRQANKINAAIGAVTAEDSFNLVLALTRQALAKNGGAVADALGTVLTEVCHTWFDIPDGKHIMPGGVRLDVTAPPRCPGDYNFPSALIFYPDPAGVMSQLGAGQGQLLRAGADALVKEVCASGELPKGPLSRAVFEAFPDDDELIARSLLGIMMGMIPTTLINVGNCLKMWSGNDNAGFKELAVALMKHGGAASYDRAKAVLFKPMTQTIQGTPEPPAVWRTALKDHELGGIQVAAGDKIIVSILGACHEDLADDAVTLDPVFGGDRSENDHPLHACPGSAAAVGFMLGFINAVVEPT